MIVADEVEWKRSVKDSNFTHALVNHNGAKLTFSVYVDSSSGKWTWEITCLDIGLVAMGDANDFNQAKSKCVKFCNMPEFDDKLKEAIESKQKEELNG